VELYRFPQAVIRDLHAEVLPDLVLKHGQLFGVPTHLVRVCLSGKAHYLNEVCRYEAFPIVVDTAHVVAAVDADNPIEELEITSKHLIKAVAWKAAVDAAVKGIRFLCTGAARRPHPKRNDPGGRDNLLRYSGAEVSYDLASLILPTLQHRVDKCFGCVAELLECLGL
jgi:hypothetical protein